MLFSSLILLFASFCQAKPVYEPITKEEIDFINWNSPWKADPRYVGYDVEHFKRLCGVPLDDNIPPRPKKLEKLPGYLMRSVIIL